MTDTGADKMWARLAAEDPARAASLKRGLKRRYAREGRFKLYGILAVSVAVGFLLLLMLLLRHPRKLVRKELLVRTLWGGREVSDAVVAQVISKLRRALVQEDLLRTLHGLGYCLDLTPTRMDEVAMPDLQAVGAEPLRRRRTLRHTEVSK